MADTYSHALLVELEENNIPRLKTKLVKYFQSKKSNGGDCQVDYESGSNTAVLRFCREEDQKNVLQKEAHQITLDKGVLKMTVRLLAEEKTSQDVSSDKVNKNSDVAATNKQPSVEERKPTAEVQIEAKGGDDSTTDEELCSTSSVLENVSGTLSQEFLEMLVENILKNADSTCASQNFTLETFSDISSTVVTFQTAKENTNFMERCPQNRTFTKKGLSVRPLEVTKQVVVEDISNVDEEIVRLYFENEGGDVEDIVFNDVEQSGVITFKDHQAVKKILKKKHHIKQKAIRVYPFYKSLGITLYGKDKPSLKPPAAISEPIDNAIWGYLTKKQSAAETIRSNLEKHFCSVNLGQSTVRLTPMSSLLQQKDAKAIVKEWKDTVKSAFAQALSEFKSLKFHPELDMWEECEEKIRQMLRNEDVVVVPDKANKVLSVGGLVSDVNRLEKSLTGIVSQIAKRVQREKQTRTQGLKVSPSIFHILCQDGLQEKLLRVYPELKMSFPKESQDLMLTGLTDEILTASKVITDAMISLKRQNLELDNSVLDLVKDEQQEELTDALLTSKGIHAAFEIGTYAVQLVAVSDRDLKDAQDYLRRLLISECIDVEDLNVLEKPEWQDLVSRLENDNSRSCRRIRIHTTSRQVVVSGHKDIVIKVSSELNNFLKQNAEVEETVVVKPNAIIEYIKNQTSWLDQLEEKVVVSCKKEAICLSGPRVDVTHCKTLVEEALSSVVFDSLKLPNPGVKKFFKDKEAMYISSIKDQTGCLVQLVDETGQEEDDSAHGQVAQPVYQLQTSEGVEIVVCKADMCSYPVHAVVNASNQDLKHDGGLAKALLNAAGPQLQVECDKLINSRGQLKPGDCVITGAGGQLCCKKIIHAVGPAFEPNNPKKSLAQLKRAVKGSLELAELHGCISVALPAISRGKGFPLGLCTVTIAKAVKEYCDEMYDDNPLNKIHFVNNDDSAVQAMEVAVRQEFGNHGVSHSVQTPGATNPNKVNPVTATKSPLSKHPGSDPCLGRAHTKEGLKITLKKGNIEAATTEVTVNTVFEDLALNKGAVSNAILKMAGPKLQQLVHAKNTSGTVGEVIVTDGCKLKSKQVFHAVVPHWDKGKGTAEKTLSGIFRNCLGLAEENGLTSISFPAIGTGGLGFPKDLVASLMLDEILEFSKKQPKHLKKVAIILYSGDAPTIQVFSDEFTKKFPNATGGSVESAPQTSGPFSKIVSSSGMHETKMGGVTIQVVTGDITKETTDVIVNSSNENFSLKSGVSKAILDAAGQAVEVECQNLGALANQGMIMTQPGNLQCKKILHLCGQTDPVKIKKVVTEALLMCVKDSHTSVAFPAIGTGQGNVQAKQVADAMLDAVVDVLSQNTSSTLTTIRIVIFQPPMLNEFHSSMQQREATGPKDKGWFWENIKKIKTYFGGGTSDKSQKEGDFVIEPLKVDPTCFLICGDTQAQVDLAKERINDLISQEQNKICIPDSAILCFSDADHQHIKDIQKTMGVSIRIEKKKETASLTIEGFREVVKASDEIHKMLKKAREDEHLKKKVELAGTFAEWQYQQHGLQFQRFDAMANFQLEQALEKEQPDVKVKISGEDYTVNLSKRSATNSKGDTLNIKRIDKLKDEDTPEHWDTMPAKTRCHAVTIQAGTPEHAEVLSLFQATCNRAVTKIERIQNPTLWKSVQIKKRDMDQRNGHQNNERRLFHGTCETTLSIINELGFNRSYAGKNAACYGNGTYFAVNAIYSAHDTYSKPNQSGEKFMYLCRVLTGEFTVGQKDMKAPPSKSSSISFDLYDTVVDNVATPSIFVVFHDSQAYPEYLITFK
ncbi:poly(ADP-ribose) polymerase family member 14-related sequence 1 isoform X2 [Mugil cephalus]|uniref:poly(ADP-ribose) polymerase family member 14-related sequence 1 isoform X2 n=1 Tax=Mugil cephalus TaxID=48193 RepID=UPI001FB72D61|nr:poly(ADP-ribose) polymerase family member 14-related sequence 1 isoform X2 [Mugil cephalus]